jgi:LCP family protein required for cell wall assembly
VRSQARYARSDDTLPYDRELIRAGGVGAETARRRQARRGGPPPRRAAPSGGGARGLFRAVRRILLVALVAAIVGAVLLGVRAASFNASVSSAIFPSTALFFPLNGSDRINVLMVGYGGGDHAGAYLADSIQILSIDPETDTTTTIPIPRDLWIEGVASFPRNGKVNEVFATGAGSGAEPDLDAAAAALAETLTDVTGLEIDHWLSIDFAGFREMVDAVGGVTVHNPTPFCWTTIPEFHQAGRWEMGCFEEGAIHLDGEGALEYSRARYTSVVTESTDFARSVRQARVMGALRSGVGDGGIGAVPAGLGLMDAMEGRMRTDLSAIDLALLAGHLTSDRRIELSEDVVLTATTNSIGQYILIPIDWRGPGDYDGLRVHLASELGRPVAAPATDAP